jgi:lysozyme family protein
MNFDQAFDTLIGHEGGYAFHPSDPGGETMWGVTANVARKDGYTGEMILLPRERAKAIYRKKYWDAVQADKLPEPMRYSVFDAAVNSGTTRAVEWLQDAIDVGADGKMGPLTLAAAKKVDPVRAAILINALRLDFMTSLPTWGHFGKGWARRIVSNLKGIK